MITTDKTLVKAINRYQKAGFDKDFKFENGRLRCLQSKKIYAPEDMLILESQRFEGMSNPSDMSALFVLKCKDGTKGLVTVAYGTYADVQVLEFLNKVKIQSSQVLSIAQSN